MKHVLTIYGHPPISVGRHVHSSIWGDGVVDYINTSFKFPLKIHFESKSVYVFFDKEGKRWKTDEVELIWKD